MTTDELKQKIRQTLTLNPDKKITPAELEDVMIDMVGNQPSQESVIKKELFFDDGSGEVVPVKHPDLSTQPSILPYKFAGNYVYEQMVWVDGEKFSDYNIGEIDLIKFQDYRLDIKSTILIGHHVFIVGHEHYGNCTPLPYDSSFCFNIASNDKRIFLKRNGPSSLKCKGVWVRVVWTTGPNAGEYYYYQQGYNEEVTLTLISGSSTIASFPMTLEIDGREIDWVDNRGNISLYGDLLDRFLSGKAAITVKRGANYHGTITFFNSHTNERGDMFIYPGDTFGLNSLASLAYNTYSNLMRGVSQELILVLE